MKHLPPILALRAFEAASRRQSYSRAAEELSVTHSAISQQIRRLEADLGTRLFERRGNAMIPTAEAKRLAASLRVGFDLLHDALTDFRAAFENDPLVVSLCSQFASRWLPARLPRLLASSAGANIELRVDDYVADLVTDGVDMGIRYGAGLWPGLVSERLIAETLTPVCTPDFAAHWRLRRPADLLSVPLLHGAHRPWSLWFEAMGLAAPPVGPMRFEDSLNLVTAATEGLGVALARSSLIEPDLHTGRLIAPLRHADVPSDLGYFLVWRADSGKLTRIHALRDRLLALAAPATVSARAAA